MTFSHFDRVENTSGKRRKCWSPTFSPFSTLFSKALFCRVVKTLDCVVKSYIHSPFSFNNQINQKVLANVIPHGLTWVENIAKLCLAALAWPRLVITGKTNVSGVYWNQPVCPYVHVSVCPTVYKILVTLYCKFILQFCFNCIEFLHVH